MAQINIAGTLHNTEEIQGDALNSHVVAHTDEILDSTKEKKQSEVNADVDTALADRYTKEETYSKSQVDNLITTPEVQYVTVATYSALPATGEADTIYRVASWDGSAVDAGKYSEYAWNGTAYQLLAVRSGSLDGVFDISANNLTEGQPTQYADLTAALGTNGANVPVGVRAGGMQVRFINSTSGKYEQLRYMGTDVTTAATFTNVSNWQGVDSTPTAGSQNLVTSGGVENELSQLNQEINGVGTYTPMELELITGGYYGVSNNTMRNTVTEREDTSCVQLSVSAGEKYKIFGRGTEVIHLYAFTDDSNDILLSNEVPVNYRNSGFELETPQGATKLFVNFYLYDSSQDKLEQYIVSEGLKSRIQDVEESVQDLEASLSECVNEDDIVDDLETGGSNKVLSAEQGKALNNSIIEINEQISGGSYYAPMELTLISDSYWGKNASLNTVNVNTTSRVGIKCSKLDVLPGDKFKLFGKGTDAICLYIFADASRNILLKNTENINSRENGIEVIAPQGATNLYINFVNYLSSDKAEKYISNLGIEQRVEILELSSEDIEQRVDNLENSIKTALTGKTFIAFGDSITEFKWPSGSGGDNKGWIEHTEEILGCQIINCAVGGTHMSAARYCELFDPSHSYSENDYVFYKPSTTMNLYKCINAHNGAWIAADFEDVSETDAISNVAYAPLNIYRMIQAYCNIDIIDTNERFKNQIAAAECIYTWKPSHDDNRAIIERLKNVNPESVDGLIIEEGTNDYAAASQRGTSGSFDITTTLGATNKAISDICSTFKEYAVFYITPPIRWWGWDNGSGELANFSDFYKANGDGDITLREWVSILKNEYQLNHVPVCDIYNELGWNQYNFSNYFPDNDGTHPRPGFQNIGAKVASFLVSMNVLKPS